jgi:CelD/BcsL family acetyltransferase involved in cellulose biosynthesis
MSGHDAGGPVRSAARRLDVEVLESLAPLEAEWRALASNCDNVFGTWQWSSTWWRHFGRDRPLVLLACRDDDGGLVAIWPLYLARLGPLRVLRLIGHGATDQLGPVCHPDDRPAAAAALRDVLDRPPRDFDLLIADELPADVDWVRVLRARLLARQASPVATFDGATWSAWLSGRSRGLATQLARDERRLASLGAVSYRCTTVAASVRPDLARVWALHDARWRAAGGSRAFTNREAFHVDFAEQAFELGWLRLRFLDLDGRPVAALYNIRFGGAEYFYQAGRDPDPELDRASVGLLLHAHAIQDAIGDGLREYRMLRGDEPYKYRFADRDPGLTSVSVARTARGAVVRPGVARVGHLPRWAVRRVPSPLAWQTGASPMWGKP